MADFGATNLDAFRAEVRAWLEANYPAELRSSDARTDPEAVWGGRAFVGSDDPQAVWMRRAAERGLTAPTWPKDYGGGGGNQGVVEAEAVPWREHPYSGSLTLPPLATLIFEHQGP